MLDARNISYRYPKTCDNIFSGYSLSIAGGNAAMLIGENGSGKSTLGKLLCGLVKPVSGEVRINDTNPYTRKPSQRIKLAYYITQANQLQFVNSTLQGEIKACEKISGNKADTELYKNFFLPGTDFNPFELSVNQAWRFAVYLAMIIDPYLLFIDEIPSAVNEHNREVLQLVLSQRNSESQVTILSYQRKINLDFGVVVNI
jgi:energy-coupling factor transporter ATP-binding protein EcfA2